MVSIFGNRRRGDLFSIQARPVLESRQHRSTVARTSRAVSRRRRRALSGKLQEFRLCRRGTHVNSFEDSFARGKLAEGRIAQWLRRRGCTIIPAYDIEIHAGKGPQVFTPDQALVAPDLLILKDKQPRWIEAKSKTVFSWDRSHGWEPCWVTGIDLHHYEQYQAIEKHFNWDVW